MGCADSAGFRWIWCGGAALALVLVVGCPMPNPAWKDGATVASTPGTSEDPSSAGSESASESASSMSEGSTTMGVVSETGTTATGGTTTGNVTTGSTSTTDPVTSDSMTTDMTTGGLICTYSNMLSLMVTEDIDNYAFPGAGCDAPKVEIFTGLMALLDDQTVQVEGVGDGCPGLALGATVTVSGSWPIPPQLPPAGCGRLLVHFGGPKCDLMGIQIIPQIGKERPFYAASVTGFPLTHNAVMDVNPILLVDPELMTCQESDYTCQNENNGVAGVFLMKWEEMMVSEGLTVFMGDSTFRNIASHRRPEDPDCVREVAWVFKRDPP